MGEHIFYFAFINMNNYSIRKENTMMKKRILSIILTICFCLIYLPMFANAVLTVETAAPVYPGEPNALSCILMDAKTGAVLYEYHADEALPPASVTKVMTMLLVFEAIDEGRLNLTDIIRVSETAAEMGGSQIYLAAGEEMSVNDLLKGLIVSSANDAAVALAEAICGSEEAFVIRMNERAAELGMKNTHFENTNGLDDKDKTVYEDNGKQKAQFNVSKGYLLPTTIDKDTVFKADRLYIVGQDVVIPKGVTVTFEEGCKIQFYDDREYYNSPKMINYGVLEFENSEI